LWNKRSEDLTLFKQGTCDNNLAFPSQYVRDVLVSH